MSNQPPRLRMSLWIMLPVWLFILVVLYLASFGPVMGLAVDGQISNASYSRMCDTLYFPIVWGEDKTHFISEHPVGRVFQVYVNWWAD